MKGTYLEVTFRHGRPLAAYLYLPRRPDAKSHQISRLEPGLVIDFDPNGIPIGIEITASTQISVHALNEVLDALGQQGVTPADLAPLRAA